MVKNPPTKRETWVQSLGQEDPLEKRMATHSSILAWRIPWTEEPGGLQSMGSKRVGHELATEHFLDTGVGTLTRESGRHSPACDSTIPGVTRSKGSTVSVLQGRHRAERTPTPYNRKQIPSNSRVGEQKGWVSRQFTGKASPGGPRGCI